MAMNLSSGSWQNSPHTLAESPLLPSPIANLLLRQGLQINHPLSSSPSSYLQLKFPWRPPLSLLSLHLRYLIPPTQLQFHFSKCLRSNSVICLRAFGQLCLSRSGIIAQSVGVSKPYGVNVVIGKDRGGGGTRMIRCQATSVPAKDRVPDMGKRKLMNLILLGTLSLPTGFMLVPYLSFFVPPG